MRLLSAAVVSLLSVSSLASPLQHLVGTGTVSASPQKLHGRFIHLTDLHPDPYYRFNSSEAASCHSVHNNGDRDAKGDRAGWWGTSVSDCDAPLTLINATFDHLEEQWKGKVDFVVWTGDNARHDIDDRLPRTLDEIFQLNRYVAERIHRTFGNVPVVTSLGNNDVFPHNICFAGPSRITSEYLSVWKRYIPEVHLHSFARGGYFTTEAIPNHLMLVSLNTLYFFENNKAVDGCPAPKKWNDFSKGNDPGTEQLMWLEQQLLLARARGMQVWLTGHVPATKANWYGDCYTRFGELTLAFQDTIVGSLFGHLNIDHFSVIKGEDVLPRKKKLHKGKRRHGRFSLSSLVSTFGAATLVDDLLSQYQSLPAPEESNEDDFHVIHVNPSVIPTYLPAFRVWEYNTTVESRWRQPPDGSLLWANDTSDGSILGAEVAEDDPEDDEECEEEETLLATSAAPTLIQRFVNGITPGFLSSPPPPPGLVRKRHGRKHKGRHGKKRRRNQPSYPPLARHASPDSPSRRNTYLTPLAYTQYMMQLDDFNAWDGYGSREAWEKGGERARPTWQIEYSTKRAEELVDEGASTSTVQDVRDSGVAPYEMEDLTIGKWLALARRLAGDDRAWKAYRRRMFVSSGADE